MSDQRLPAGLYRGPQPAEPHVTQIAAALRRRAQRMALVGFLWLLGGLGISIASWLLAPPGGTYQVFWGAALFGVYRCIRGLYYMADPSKLLR